MHLLKSPTDHCFACFDGLGTSHILITGLVSSPKPGALLHHVLCLRWSLPVFESRGRFGFHMILHYILAVEAYGGSISHLLLRPTQSDSNPYSGDPKSQGRHYLDTLDPKISNINYPRLNSSFGRLQSLVRKLVLVSASGPR